MKFFHAEKKFEKFEDVTPKILKKAGVKFLMCDLDNTLRLHSEKEPAEELAEWIKTLHKSKIKVIVISNNGRKKMIQKFCGPLKIPCKWWAMKPMSRKLTEAMTEYGFKPSETVMLGDKYTTDVLAAHFAGIRAWKVEHRKDIV